MMHIDSTVNLIEVVRVRALANGAKVAIGVRNPTPKDISSMEKAQEEGYARVVLVGDKQQIDRIGTFLEIINTHEPENVLGDLLASGSVDAAVRGTARASKTLSHLRNVLNMEKLHRMAFLLTSEGKPFFLAPVGIDEGESLKDKIVLMELGVEYIRRFDIDPVLGIISGGRMGDLGRDPVVDKTLAEGDFLENRMKEKGIDARHYTILIEEAIKEVNFIFAPDGITGNLMFRTLVFLGGGDGIGAPVLMDDHVFVDTSRAGGHYKQAIMLASALVDMKEERMIKGVMNE